MVENPSLVYVSSILNKIESLSILRKDVKVCVGQSPREGNDDLINRCSWMKDTTHRVEAIHICWIASYWETR